MLKKGLIVEKLFQYLLIISLIVLLFHIAVTIVTEKQNSSRWHMTAAGKAYRDALIEALQGELYGGGGEAANSALLLSFKDKKIPLTSDAHKSNVYFDFDGDGRAVKTAWIEDDSAFLLLTDESFKNTRLTGLQMFGNHLSLPEEDLGKEKHPVAAAWGFKALKFYDDDLNDKIDSADAVWEHLKAWRDLNHNALIEENELFSLNSLGINSLNLKIKDEGLFIDNKNYLFASSSFDFEDGEKGQISEIFFQQISAMRKFTSPVPIAALVKAEVPDYSGSGYLRDLQEAMGSNAHMFKLVERFNEAKSRAERMGVIDEILSAWSASAGIESDPEIRAEGAYSFSTNCLRRLNATEKASLSFLDAWVGRYHYRLANELFPGQDADEKIIVNKDNSNELAIICPDELWENLTIGYNDIKRNLYHAFARDANLKPLFEMMDFGELKINWEKLQDYFETYFKENPTSAAYDLLDLRLILLNEQISSRRLPGLDAYIDAKLENIEMDNELEIMYLTIKNRVPILDMNKRNRRLKSTWGTDSIGY